MGTPPLRHERQGAHHIYGLITSRCVTNLRDASEGGHVGDVPAVHGVTHSQHIADVPIYTVHPCLWGLIVRR